MSVTKTVYHHRIKILTDDGACVLGWVEGGVGDPRPDDFFAFYEDDDGKEIQGSLFDLPTPGILLELLQQCRHRQLI